MMIFTMELPILLVITYISTSASFYHSFKFSKKSLLHTNAKHRNVIKYKLVTTEASLTTSPYSVANEVKDAVVVGGGPAGLLSAIMLSQKLPNSKVKVFERRSEPISPHNKEIWSDVARFYLMGIGFRGQNALNDYGVLEDFNHFSTQVVGRKDWSPESSEGMERIYTERKTKTRVIPRDKLVGVMHEHILKNYAGKIELNYDCEVQPISFGESGEKVELRINKCSTLDPTTKTDNTEDVTCDVDSTPSYTIFTDLLIGVDGTARSIANQIQKEEESLPKFKNLFKETFAIRRYEDDNERVYKTIPMKLPSDWRHDLNYSARTKDGVNIDALPADKEGNYCAVLLMKRDHPFSQPDTDSKALRQFFNDQLPQFSQLLSDEVVENVAKKPSSTLPKFRYVSPKLHYLDRTAILGDCAHTVKPYFGLGANSALEDVQILGNIIDSSTSLPKALKTFTKVRAKEVKTLVQISRSLDRPGKLGFVTFILPIILDSIFQQIPLLNKIFSPNTLALFQKEGWTFSQIKLKKRFDRILQVTFIGTAVWGLTKTVSAFMQFCMKRWLTSSQRVSIVSKYFVLSIVLLAGIKNLSGYFFKKDTAAADVLNKSKGTL